MKVAILVVDDQELYCRSLSRALEGDYEVRIALNLGDAKLHADGVKVALVDICLSGTDPRNREGLELVKWIKSNHRNVRIVAMSALEDKELDDKTRSAGSDYFLRKPIVVSELKHILVRLQNE